MNTLDLPAAARHALAVVASSSGSGSRARGREHPPWCGRAHHCTAHHTSGEHRSIPEVWNTSVGRAVGVRTRRASDGVDHMEIRLAAELAFDDPTAERQCRALLAATAATVHDVLTGCSEVNGHLP